MKLSFVLSFLAVLSIVLATSHPIISSRQAHVRRDLVDVCAAIDTDLELFGIVDGGLPLVADHLEVCLCVSALPLFIQTNAVASLAVLASSEQQVFSTLEGLIRSAPTTKTCAYPVHSKPFCDFENGCEFRCIDGYQRGLFDNRDACICPRPLTECKGKCGFFSGGCTSAVPERTDLA